MTCWRIRRFPAWTCHLPEPLIYIEPETQDRILLRCHFALRPNAIYFLAAPRRRARTKALSDFCAKSQNYQRQSATTPRNQIDLARSIGKPAGAGIVSRAFQRKRARVAPAGNLTPTLCFERSRPPAVLVNERMETLYSPWAGRAFPPARAMLQSINRCWAAIAEGYPRALPAATRRAQAHDALCRSADWRRTQVGQGGLTCRSATDPGGIGPPGDHDI